VWRARERGVLFDVGHGSSSFAFEVAKSSLEQGFAPDFISSDIHSKNIAGPVFDLPTTMSKFLALGMPLYDVIARCTQHPAIAIGRPDLGGLFEGELADVTILDLDESPQSFQDVQGTTVKGSYRLRARHTLVAGRLLEPLHDGRVEASGSRPIPAPRGFQ
jgi:dihydroorotase